MQAFGTTKVKRGNHIYVNLGCGKQHGIYYGDDLVIYWVNTGSVRGRVCIATLHKFSQGKQVKKRNYHNRCKSADEVIQRAKRRLKESKPKYRFADSKAFAIYCKTGLKIGDHIYVDYGSFYHHGIYYGNDKVAHYYKTKVCITSLSKFANGRMIRVKNSRGFSSKRVIRRAKSRLDEKKYNLVFNNCEHFSTWCKTGRSKSKQVEDLPKSAAKFTGYNAYKLVQLILW